MLLNSQNVFSVNVNDYNSLKEAVKGSGTASEDINLTGNINNAYDYGRGGAIYNLASTIITAADGKSISFSENHAVNQGGAIFSGVYTGNNANLVGVGTLDIKTEGTGSVLFTGNTANYGGAIANSETATIIGDAIKFESNSAKNGGALYLDKNVNFNIGNSVFRKNCTSADNGNGWGGAIGLGTNGNINGYVENSLFERNYAGDAGGVVAANTAITFVNSKFINNSARFSGGAIYNKGITNITATDSNTVEFTDNKANSTSNDIYNEGTLNLITSVDGKIIFNSGISGNSANLGTINIGNDVNSNLGNVILSSTVSNQNVNLKLCI